MKSYANHFSLAKHFRLNATVLSVLPLSPGPNPRWNVRYIQTGGVGSEVGEQEEKYDRVLITTGPFNRAWIPRYDGMDEYEGVVIHAQAYKGYVRLGA
jgi:dimethylaniline monooxygenase (N-oxide forming)